jgi:hypothetical protein
MKQQNDRERQERESEIRRMKQQNVRERMEKENAIQLMLNEVKQREEQLKEKDREITELRNQFSRASLLTSQVNKGKLSRFAVMSAVLSIFVILHHDQNNHHQLPLPPSTPSPLIPFYLWST